MLIKRTGYSLSMYIFTSLERLDDRLFGMHHNENLTGGMTTDTDRLTV